MPLNTDTHSELQESEAQAADADGHEEPRPLTPRRLRRRGGTRGGRHRLRQRRPRIVRWARKLARRVRGRVRRTWIRRKLFGRAIPLLRQHKPKELKAPARYTRNPKLGNPPVISIDTQGDSEMAALRQRVHGREVSRDEIKAHVKPYMRRHIALQKLYRARVLRY